MLNGPTLPIQQGQHLEHVSMDTLSPCAPPFHTRSSSQSFSVPADAALSTMALQQTAANSLQPLASCQRRTIADAARTTAVPPTPAALVTATSTAVASVAARLVPLLVAAAPTTASATLNCPAVSRRSLRDGAANHDRHRRCRFAN